jgi:hypothetical protein
MKKFFVFMGFMLIAGLCALPAMAGGGGQPGCEGCIDDTALMLPNQWEPGILTDNRIDAVFVNDTGKGKKMVASKLWRGRAQIVFYNGTRDLNKLDEYPKFREALARAIELKQNRANYSIWGMCGYYFHR